MDSSATPQRGSPKLQEWVERWNSALTRFLRRRLPASIDAEDLAQEVYLRLLRVEHLDSVEDPKAYLYQVARNTAAEWRARAREVHPHGSKELDSLIELTTPEDLLQLANEQRLMNSALSRLPVQVRSAIYLKLRDGKTYDEISQHMGVSTRMVRKYLSAGYSALRQHLITERCP